jgi:hypothetical protein
VLKHSRRNIGPKRRLAPSSSRPSFASYSATLFDARKTLPVSIIGQFGCGIRKPVILPVRLLGPSLPPIVGGCYNELCVLAAPSSWTSARWRLMASAVGQARRAKARCGVCVERRPERGSNGVFHTAIHGAWLLRDYAGDHHHNGNQLGRAALCL